MKARIYYFTGTGNSLAVARRIAKSMKECELVPIAKAMKERALLECKNSVCGIVVPNYYMGLPAIVAEFISKASFIGSQYIFMVVTSGHDFGIALREAEQLMKKKGKYISFGRYLVMPDSYLPMFNIHPEQAKALLLNAEPGLVDIIKDITASRQGIKERSLFAGALLTFIHNKMARTFASRDKKFIVDDTCNSCGICAKVCPVDNIIMSSGKPAWQHKCEQCFACAQLCPQTAIQYGKSTRNKHRYHHPEINAADIAQQKA
jgi:Pyruvate/2-oxoacid:ferredoxin oxidoreductase delta subunit/flavodoxin